MSTHEARLAELNKRISEIDGAISQLDDAYAGVAAQFNAEDKETLRQAEQIEQKVAWLRRERALAVAAGNRVLEDAKAEAIQREQDDRCAVLASARKIADAVATLHAEIDDALVQLRQMLERRMALLRELQNTGVADAVVVKLMQKGPVNRALAAAGLHRFVDISTPSPGSFLPLRNAHPILAGVGRLNGGGGHD
jgi:hypothetical protein